MMPHSNDMVPLERHSDDALGAPLARGVPYGAVVVVALVAWVLTVYTPTTASMVTIWDRSDTFAHGYLIVPLFLYLLWRDRDALAALAPKPFLPALAGIAAAGIVWLLAAQLRINSVAQFAMVAMIPLGVWAVLGTAVVRRLAFPLGFLFFAVPVGEFLIPILIEWTADVTVLAIRASGVPIYREGTFFTIPTGRWSVVEACSGLRYLIASFVVGCLFAYLFFRSARRRWIFIGVSLLVPIVANWMRAYVIVMLGHLSDNRIAAGADHLLYGWVFFGVVMAVLFWFGARWREDAPAAGTPSVPPPVVIPPGLRRSLLRVLCAAIVLMALWPLLDLQWRSGANDTSARTLGPIAGAAGWQPAEAPLSAWRPDLASATIEHAQTFTRDGTRVALFIALFDDPTGEAKAITSTNQLVRTTNKQWSQLGAGTLALGTGDGVTEVRTAVIAHNRERLAAWQWYWVGGRTTVSDWTARLDEMLGLLQGRRKPVAWVIVYTPTERGTEDARATLQAFTADMGTAIDAALRRATERR
jgi:exosortase A